MLQSDLSSLVRSLVKGLHSRKTAASLLAATRGLSGDVSPVKSEAVGEEPLPLGFPI